MRAGRWRSPADTEARLARAVAALDEHQRLAGIAALRPAIGREAYLAAVAEIHRLIEAGDCYQVNFTWPLEGEAWGAPLALYQRLRAAQPVRHGACILDPGIALLSRSPELFVRREGELALFDAEGNEIRFIHFQPHQVAVKAVLERLFAFKLHYQR